MEEPQAKSASHLSKLSLRLLLGGLGALVVSTLLQWTQFQEGRGRSFILDGFGVALAAQVLMVLGTAALTGAAFGYVLLAVRRDREPAEDVYEQEPDAEWLD
jgi:hypothetical protein